MDPPGRGRGPALRAATVGHGRGRARRPGRWRRASESRDDPWDPARGRRSRSWRRWSCSRPMACRRRPLAERHGSSSLAGLVRRGLLRAEVRERPRRPLARRPARPAVRARRVLADGGPGRSAAPRAGGAGRRRPHADPARRGHGRRQDRDLRGGHRRVAGRRPACAPAGPRDRAGDAHRGPPAGGPRGPGRRHALRRWARGSAPTSGAGSVRARRTSSSGPGRPCLPRLPTSG